MPEIAGSTKANHGIESTGGQNLQQLQELQQHIELQRLQQSQMFLQQHRLHEIQVTNRSAANKLF